MSNQQVTIQEVKEALKLLTELTDALTKCVEAIEKDNPQATGTVTDRNHPNPLFWNIRSTPCAMP